MRESQATGKYEVKRLQGLSPDFIKALKQAEKKPRPKISKEIFEQFSVKRKFDISIMIEGIEEFTHIANLSFQERQHYFGSPFRGLHYRTDLANYFNHNYKPKENVIGHTVETVFPLGWRTVKISNMKVLLYKGASVSKALDNLLLGPTVIDCGMFCQLAIWFGIRYMLGNQLFDQIFGSNPLYVTPSIYQGINQKQGIITGNPLFEFFDKAYSNCSRSGDDIMDSIAIQYIKNYGDYANEHPGGVAGGFNTLLINGQYSIFDPVLDGASNMTLSEIIQRLVGLYLRPADIHDDSIRALMQNQKDEKNSSNSQSHIVDSSSKNLEKNLLQLQSRVPTIILNFKRLVETIQARLSQIIEVQYSPKLTDGTGLKSKFKGSSNEKNIFHEKSSAPHNLQQLAKQFCRIVVEGFKGCYILPVHPLSKSLANSCYRELKQAQKKDILWFPQEFLSEDFEQLKKLLDDVNNLREAKNEIIRNVRKALLSGEFTSIILYGINPDNDWHNVILKELFKHYINGHLKTILLTVHKPIAHFDYMPSFKVNQQYNAPTFVNYTSKAHLQFINMSSAKFDNTEQALLVHSVFNNQSQDSPSSSSYTSTSTELCGQLRK